MNPGITRSAPREAAALRRTQWGSAETPTESPSEASSRRLPNIVNSIICPTVSIATMNKNRFFQPIIRFVSLLQISK